MDFQFSTEDETFRKQLCNFLQEKVTDEVVEEISTWKTEGPLGKRLLRELGEKGWLLALAPREYGGIGASYLQQYIALDEIAYFTKTWALTSTVATGPFFMLFGNNEQKKKYLTQLARGEIEVSEGYTEPEAGSDLTSIKSYAVEHNNHWTINGHKIYTTAGCHADYQVLCARTEEATPRHRGLSLFIIPMDSPGITIRPMWTMANYKVGEEFYDDVRVPKENLLGEKNKGFQQLMSALDLVRIFPLPVGYLRQALEELAEYAKRTERGGKVLAADTLVRQKIAEMAIEVEVARNLAYRTVWMLDQGKPVGLETSVVKVFVSELVQRLDYTGLRIMGLHGQLELGSKHAHLNGLFGQQFLLSTFATIAGGANEIQRNIIAQRGLGLPRS